MSFNKSPYAQLYFHGKITRDQAEDLLMSQGAIEGMFLLRESVNGNFVLSICHNNRVNHYNIEKQFDNLYQILTGRKFSGPVELVEHHMLHLDGLLTLANIPLERYPSGASYYILQGVRSSLLDECLEKKAIDMGLKDKVTIHEALDGPMRKHLQYLVFKDLHCRQPWFHHYIGRLEAKKRLEDAGYTDGQFLVRRGKDDIGFVLSLCYQGQSKHYRINEHLEKLQIDGGQYFDTLMELIDHYHFRQDGMLCKLRFGVECPGYVRSITDWTRKTGDAYFEGNHTALCDQWSKEHCQVITATRSLYQISSNKSDPDNQSPDLINFNEWSTNLTKILDYQTSSSMTTSLQNNGEPKSPDVNDKTGNVFRTIKNSISSPQALFTSVKEILQQRRHCHDTRESIISKNSDVITGHTIYNQIHQETNDAKPVQSTSVARTKEENKFLPRSTSTPLKLHPADLTLLDPLFEDKSQIVTDKYPANSPSFNLSFEKLEVKHKLGCGNFGYVYSGFYEINNSVSIPVAIKMLKTTIHSSIGSQEILSEAAIMAKLVHDHIVRLIGICKIDRIFLVLELAPLGPINKYLRQNINTPIWNLIELMIQVAKGMAYLESVKFVHRDLAARNVLLVNNNYAKISDFGMSKALNFGHEYYRAVTAGKWPLKWYAPECLYYFRFDSKSDVWSYGITMWEVFSFGEKPYKGLKGTEILAMLEKGQRLKRPSKCPECIYEVMLQCWAIEGIERPSFAELVKTTTQMASSWDNNVRYLPSHNSYQATSSGSSVAKTSYGSGDFSHFSVMPSDVTETETWSKVSLSDNISDI